MGFIGNPQITQGTLNRIRAHLVVANYTQLNVAASYMGKSMLELTLEEPFVHQIPTAVGIVNSPEPYVMGTIAFSLLRTQALADAWLSQAQLHSVLGNVDVYPDSAAFATITLLNTSIVGFTPGPYDGQDPGVKVTLKGQFPVNSDLWSPVAAQ
jgi:hypothetical protein